jgi:hypothetical protein
MLYDCNYSDAVLFSSSFDVEVNIPYLPVLVLMITPSFKFIPWYDNPSESLEYI